MDKKPATNNQMSASSSLIGRESELAVFAAVLEQAKPAVVVVTGDPGTGKTALLQAFEEMAKTRSWRTTRREDQRFLRVSPQIDEYQFFTQVRGCFEEGGHAGTISASPLTAVSEVSSSMNLNVMAQLARWTPLLLLIDGYEPTADFDNWFKTTFIDTLRKSHEPLVLVISDRPDRVAALQGKQNEFIPLSPLTREVVRDHFASLSKEITPSLAPGEVDAYVEAVLKDPGLLTKLNRVLLLARPVDTAEAGD